MMYTLDYRQTASSASPLLTSAATGRSLSKIRLASAAMLSRASDSSF